MTETLANGYSYEVTQREPSNEYQHDRVKMVFKNLCVLVLLEKVASALEGLLGQGGVFLLATSFPFTTYMHKLVVFFTHHLKQCMYIMPTVYSVKIVLV